MTEQKIKHNIDKKSLPVKRNISIRLCEVNINKLKNFVTFLQEKVDIIDRK